jgi:HAD superfamily hydrolase (TIGR01509 family)
VPGAFVFDLYGTLVRIGRPVFQRAVSSFQAERRRDWVTFEREVLLLKAYPTHGEFVRAILDGFVPGATEERYAEVLALLEEELLSVALEPGARSFLQFLKRRGHRLALLSNSASPYRDPLARLGLADLFDVVLFSCDEGIRKPDLRLFTEACRRLEIAPSDTVMVGDSLAHDVRPALEAGLQAVLVSSQHAAASSPAVGWPVVSSVADMAWWQLAGEQWRAPLLRLDEPLTLAARTGSLGSLQPLPDDDHGRYNLVARCRAHWNGAADTRVYVKRFLHPEATAIEALVHELLPLMGVEGCPTSVLRHGEPLLASAEAPGTKLADAAPEIDAPLAREIGRHFACGYLLANADLRPRNAFLSSGPDGPRLVMVDHEYCLLNRAVDLEGVSDPFDRTAIEALGREEFERRVVRQVLTPQTMRRARKQFFEAPAGDTTVGAAFKAGWEEVHRETQRHAAAIQERIEARLHAKPPLIAGTLAYRRALTRFDVEDLLARVALEPADACAPCLPGSSPSAASRRKGSESGGGTP